MCIVLNPYVNSYARFTATQETRLFISIAVTQCQALKPLEAMLFVVLRYGH